MPYDRYCLRSNYVLFCQRFFTLQRVPSFFLLFFLQNETIWSIRNETDMKFARLKFAQISPFWSVLQPLRIAKLIFLAPN